MSLWEPKRGPVECQCDECICWTSAGCKHTSRSVQWPSGKCVCVSGVCVCVSVYVRVRACVCLCVCLYILQELLASLPQLADDDWEKSPEREEEPSTEEDMATSAAPPESSVSEEEGGTAGLLWPTHIHTHTHTHTQTGTHTAHCACGGLTWLFWAHLAFFYCISQCLWSREAVVWRVNKYPLTYLTASCFSFICVFIKDFFMLMVFVECNILCSLCLINWIMC